MEQQHLGLLEIISLIGVANRDDIDCVVEAAGLKTSDVERLLRISETSLTVNGQKPTHFACYPSVRLNAYSMIAQGSFDKVLELLGPSPAVDLTSRLGLARTPGPLQKHYQATCADQIAFYVMDFLTTIFKQSSDVVLASNDEKENWDGKAILGFMERLDHEG